MDGTKTRRDRSSGESFDLARVTSSIVRANRAPTHHAGRRPGGPAGRGPAGPSGHRSKRIKERISWRLVATTRITRLLAMEDVIRKTQSYDGDAVAFDEAKRLLHSAVWTLEHTEENLHTWWTGSLRDQVWRQIHMAETYIVSRLPDAERQRRIAEILFDARLILDHDDPVMKGDPADFSAPSTGIRANNHAGRRGRRHQGEVVHETPEETAKRVYAKELVRRYREAWDDRYTASRAFRNRLIVLIAVVTVAVAILITAGSLGMITIDAPPPHATLTPELNHFLAMFTIAVLGSIGGLISGAGEVVKVGGVYNPFSLPWYLLFFKMPMGALTGILGVLAIKGDLLPDMKITMNNWSQIIIWALVFGASQQLITFMVDRRVRSLSTSIPQEHAVNR